MKGIFVILTAVVLVNCELGVKNYLLKYGYLPDGQLSYTDKDVSEAIRKYQKTFRLKETGFADEETLKLMNTPRCGMKDHGNDLYDSGWSKTNLSYYFYNYTPDMPKAVVKERTARALRYWSDVSTLKFTRKGNDDGDIVVAFGTRRHTDGRQVCLFPFDGPGGTLAHAFFPPDGRIHFDDDEYFTTKTTQGINYLWVATHEFGHILGLEHDTDNQDAVMFPYYRPYNPSSMHLHANDIRRIRELYPGAPPVTIPPTKAPTVTKKETTVTSRQPITTSVPSCSDQLLGSTCIDHKSYCKGVSKTWTNYMRRYCAKTCGYCSGGGTGPCPPECKDHNSVCPKYKERCKGYTEGWTVYMRKFCRRTCRYCCIP